MPITLFILKYLFMNILFKTLNKIINLRIQRLFKICISYFIFGKHENIFKNFFQDLI